VLIESDAWPALASIIFSVALRASSGSRLRSFDQVESVHENALIVVAVTNAIERSDPAVITGSERSLQGLRSG
jgi:hypothetical protein